MSRKPHHFDNHPMNFPNNPAYRAFCTYVVDGDTIDVFVDIGLNKYAYESIRIEGIDTPEIYRPKDDYEKLEAKRAKQLVEDLILNKQIKIETLKDKQTFGRYRANVYYYQDEEWLSLADKLKEEGLDWSD